MYRTIGFLFSEVTHGQRPVGAIGRFPNVLFGAERSNLDLVVFFFCFDSDDVR